MASGTIHNVYTAAETDALFDQALRVISSDPLVSGSDLNNIKTPGFYRTGGTLPSNAPSAATWCILLVLIVGTTYMQFLFGANNTWMRTGNSTNWYAWYKYTGTQV